MKPSLNYRLTMFDHLSATYGLPIMRGVRVMYEKKQGTIMNASATAVKVRLDGSHREIAYHPQRLTYMATDAQLRAADARVRYFYMRSLARVI